MRGKVDEPATVVSENNESRSAESSSVSDDRQEYH